MSMRPTFSPKTSIPSCRRPYVFRAHGFTPILALGLLPTFTASPIPARAQASLRGVISERDLGADAPAFHALMEGRVGDASNLLRSTLAANPSDAIAHQLLCRVNYAQDKAEDAIRECELATSAKNVGNVLASDNYLWLGRAYGMKARHAGSMGGFILARKVEASFARAVELNPNNVAALNDLGEYDVAAPFIVGGGDNKARTLAARMIPQFPAAAHLLLARLANSNGDLAAAETEFKRAVGVQGSPDAWIDLARFYQSHSRLNEALGAVKSGIAADRSHGPALVDAASVLIDANRALDLAERSLRDYLNSHSKSDQAPAFKVHLQLSRLLAARGDTRLANLEVAAAAALAPAFAHAGRSAQGL